MKRRSFLALLGLAPAAATLSHAAAETPPAAPFLFEDGVLHLPPDRINFGAVTQVETLMPDYDGEIRLRVLTGPEARGVGEVRVLTEDGQIVERAWWIA